MSLILLLALAVSSVLALIAGAAVLALWTRTVQARRRASASALAEAAEQIRVRNNALAPTDRNLPLPPAASGRHLPEQYRPGRAPL